MSVTLIIPVGAVLGFLYNRWADRAGGDVERKKRLGVFLSTGLFVGESLYGVVFAGFVAISGCEDPFAVFTGNNGTLAEIIGIVAFVVVVGWLYIRTQTAGLNR